MLNRKPKKRLYKVYHIRQKGVESLSEGYIGITKNNLDFRLSQHFCSKRPVGEILRKLGKDAVEIVQLAMLPKEEALQMEYELRPRRNMGWNQMAGGGRVTVKCPSCGKHLPKRRSGTYCIDCRDTRFQKGHTPHNYGQGEKYKLIDPEGNVYYPEAFTAFCREHNLTPQNLRKVAKGQRKHHKGWKAVRLTTEEGK